MPRRCWRRRGKCRDRGPILPIDFAARACRPRPRPDQCRARPLRRLAGRRPRRRPAGPGRDQRDQSLLLSTDRAGAGGGSQCGAKPRWVRLGLWLGQRPGGPGRRLRPQLRVGRLRLCRSGGAARGRPLLARHLADHRACALAAGPGERAPRVDGPLSPLSDRGRRRGRPGAAALKVPDEAPQPAAEPSASPSVEPAAEPSDAVAAPEPGK